MNGIKYWAPKGNSGYSEAAKDYMLGLYDAGVDISNSYFKFDSSGEKNKTDRDKKIDLLNKEVNYDTVIIHSTPEHWSEKILQYKGKRIVGITVWETDKLTPDWVPWINAVDLVIVPCEWNKQVFIESGITTKIEVLPHILKEPIIINSKIKEITNEYIFYTIGQESNRKGIMDTIRAYLLAFNGDENVALVVKSFGSNYHRNEQLLLKNKIINLVNEYESSAKIILLLDELSEDQISGLHTISDCYVSLCKAEGWGLGAFDAAGRDKPVIMTNYGGQLDYLRYCGSNFKPIDYDLIPVDGMPWIPWYKPDQKWAQPNIAHAAKLMRAQFELGRIDKKHNNLLQIYNSEKITNDLIEILCK